MSPVIFHGDYASALTPSDNEANDEEMASLVWTDQSESTEVIESTGEIGEILFQVRTEPTPQLPFRINNIWSNRHYERALQPFRPLQMRHIVDYSDMCAQTHDESHEIQFRRQVTRGANNPNNFQIQCLDVAALDAYLVKMRPPN